MAAKNGGRVLRPEELAGEQVADLPNREVMSLLDPNAVGGTLLSDPTAGTGGTSPTSTTGGTSTDPAAGATQGATQTATQGPQLAGGYLPSPSEVAGQTYQPSATSTAQS